MEKPLPDERHAVPAALWPAPASPIDSRNTINLFLASGVCERANSEMGPFPHEEDEFMPSYHEPSKLSNTVISTTSRAAGAIGLWSTPVTCWSSSTSIPRCVATIANHPLPIECLVPAPATIAESVSGLRAEAVDIAASSHSYLYNKSPVTIATKNTAKMKKVQIQSSQDGVNADTSAVTITSPPSALPITRSVAISLPRRAGIAHSISVSKRKRKRIPGAMRLRNYLCMHPGCGKSFTDSAHLRDHTVVHTGEKKLSCPTCHKLFARASTLHEHIRTHTGEKPYICGAIGCSKRYASRAAMRFHRSTHVSQIVFSADQVPTINSQEPNAVPIQTEHLMPFVCQECGKHFRVREHLMAHIMVHSADCAASVVYPLTSVSSPRLANYRPMNAEIETSIAQREIYGEYDLNGDEIVPLHGSRVLYDTIRAQQYQIEQLKAEVLRLQGQSVDTTETCPPGQVHQTVVSLVPALTAPVEWLRIGVKPFECCICHNRFANFYQLAFHGKQHPERSMNEVTGGQTPLPVGPKHCPEKQCEYAESTGRSLRNLQTLKRHWQRRHQHERPYACSYCPATRQKTFKTRENLKAHEKDCTKNILVGFVL